MVYLTWEIGKTDRYITFVETSIYSLKSVKSIFFVVYKTDSLHCTQERERELSFMNN